MTTFCDQPALLYEQSFICPFAKAQRLEASEGRATDTDTMCGSPAERKKSCLSAIDKSLKSCLCFHSLHEGRLSDVRLIETEPNHHTLLRQHSCQNCSFTTYFSIMSLFSFYVLLWIEIIVILVKKQKIFQKNSEINKPAFDVIVSVVSVVLWIVCNAHLSIALNNKAAKYNYKI